MYNFPPSIIKLQAFQLRLNFFLQLVAFLKHCGKFFCVGFHLRAEIFHGFFFKECINYLVNFKVPQTAFLVAAFLVFLAGF